MPKISAPTVAEHRRLQRAALLRAAETILLEAGVGAVTPRAVGERAGLARSSFYEYFPSKDDLLVAVAAQAFDDWNAEIEAAMASARGLDRLRVYIDATMRMTADGAHELASILQQSEISPTHLDDIMTLHDRLLAPLNRVLDELGVPDAELHAALIQGVIGSGMRLVSRGSPPERVSEGAFRLIASGLTS